MAKERLMGEDKHPFVLFSSVSVAQLRRFHQSGKYTVIYIINLKYLNERLIHSFFGHFIQFIVKFEHKFYSCFKVSVIDNVCWFYQEQTNML